MKLLFAHQNLGDFGGAEATILLEATELQRRGHTSALLYSHATGRNESAWRNIFSRCYGLPSPGHVEVVEGVLESFEPDLVFLNNLNDLPVIEALLNSGRPVVRMVHDHSLYCLRGYKYNYFTRKICTRAASGYCVFPCLGNVARNREGPLPLKWASYSQKQEEIRLNRRCHSLVVYSDCLREELVRNGFAREKIEICVPVREGGGVEVEDERDNNLILFVGQIIRGKGVDVLLKALAKLKAPFRCVILGDGSHRPFCERLSTGLGLATRVHFQGYVPPADLKAYYALASVFVMSSLWPEPFGMAGPEAMRYGLPVVAFDAGGIKEWLHDGKNGYLIPWKDTTAFAARLDHLLLNKDLAREMGRRGMASVRRYDADSQVNRLEGLFQRVLGQVRAPSTSQGQLDPVLSAL